MKIPIALDGLKKGDMKWYKKTKKFVEESFAKRGKIRMVHYSRTVFWVQKLYSKADEALLTAAVAHDIERAFRNTAIDIVKKSKDGFLDEKHLNLHQEKGANLIADFLDKEGADKKFIKKVYVLISKHEVGGNKEQNILKDADSISFFENNIDNFIEKDAVRVGKEKVRIKFDWMFDRITSDEAKKIARPWYEKGLKLLASK